MTCLVTGASGFCGRRLVELLRLRGDTAVPTDLAAPEGGLALDVSDNAAARAVFDHVRPDRVFHLAGVWTSDLETSMRVNGGGTSNVLYAAANANPSTRVLVVGSAAEYGPLSGSPDLIDERHPTLNDTPYACGKREAVRASLEWASRGLHVVVARPFNLVGRGLPGSLLVGALARRIADAMREGRDEAVMGNRFPKRDFVDVKDVVPAYLELLERAPSGTIANLASERAVSVGGLADQLAEVAGWSGKWVEDPALVRPGEAEYVIGSSALARRLIGFEAKVPLEDSLRAVWDEVAPGADKG